MSATRVVVWNPSSEGHSLRYVGALVRHAPPHVEVVAPPWLEAEAGGERYRAPDAGHELHRVHAVAAAEGADTVVLADLSVRLLSRLASGSAQPGLRYAAIDVHCSHAFPALEPARRLGPRFSATMRANLALREAAVRRFDLTFLCVVPAATQVGTALLRRRTLAYPDPIHELRPPPTSAWPRDVVRVVLPGAIGARKGLDVLTAAVERIVTRGWFPPSTEIVVAGQLTPAFRDEGRMLISRLRATGVPLRHADRYLTDDEYDALLATAHVVVLPYRRHVGTSNVLSALLGRRVHAVTTDFGWVGEVARRAGAHTFREGDAADLARVLVAAVRDRAPAALRPVEGAYASPAEFARVIWGALSPVAAPHGG